MKLVLATLSVLAALVIPSLASAAPLLPTANPVTFGTATAMPLPIHPGEAATVKVTASIERGWHLYSVVPSAKPGPLATTVSVTGNGVATAGSPTEDAPVTRFDPNFQTDVAFHEGHVTFSLPVVVASTAATGPLSATLSVRYQACNDRVCDPPATATLPVALSVTAGPVRTEFAPRPVASVPTTVRAQAPAAQSNSSAPTGVLAFIGFAFAAGLLALLTPCVFPLIPVTFGYFTKEAHGEKKRLVGLAGAYVAGIILSFVALGLIATITLGAAGPNRVASNPWINAGFGVLFVVLAFAFFETFNLSLPPALQKMAAGARGKGGLVGVLFMGLAFVFTAFTCTAPFIASVLATAASSGGIGGYARPVLGMVVFAFALSLPFFVIALFPPLLTRLPKSGAWLSHMKGVLGFVELAYAVLYFSKADLVWQAHVLTRPVIFGIWAAVFLGAALYLLGALKVNPYPSDFDKMTWPRRFGIACFAAVTLYCFYAMTGRPINKDLAAFVPEADYAYGKAQSAGSGDEWMSDYDAALAKAKAERKPVFVDFTGYTCTNCRWMEQNVFPRPEITRRLKQFVLVRLYTDGGPDAQKNEALQLKLGAANAQPLYALLDADGNKIATEIGVESDTAIYGAFLDKALAPAAPKLAAWTPYTSDAFAAAKTAGKPIVIDFTASWCVPCHAIEKQVFEDPAVKAKLDAMTTLRADFTDFDAPQNKVVEGQFGVVQLPTVVILDGTGKELPDTRVTGIVTPADFLSRLPK